MGAPVCQIAPSQPNPEDPRVLTPSIPIANQNNLVDVVNALRALLMSAFGQTGGGNNSNTNPGVQFNGFSTKQPPPSPTKKNGFTVVEQIVRPIRVYDPNDPSKQTFVDVQQVVGLKMFDTVTNQTWEWTAPYGTPTSG